ncbi:MAG TPA: S8 family serine peptidase, partial [Rubricoccaceae bacterium]
MPLAAKPGLVLELARGYTAADVLSGLPPSLGGNGTAGLTSVLADRSLGYTGGRLLLLEFAPGTDLELAADEYKKADGVVMAAPNRIFSTMAVPTPNDPEYYRQWNLPKISAPQAWGITTGASSVTVGIVDTGLNWNHPDLAPNTWGNRGEDLDSDGVVVWNGSVYVLDPDDLNGVDDDGNGYVDDLTGWDFYDDDNDTRQVNGDHGTAVAGAAGAATNNNIGIASVNWNSRLVGLRTGDGGGISFFSVGLALDYAALMGIDVANMSFGTFGTYCPPALGSAYSAGVVLVAASGHPAGTNGEPSAYSPASCPGVLAVTALEQNDVRYGGANVGAYVDLAAPFETWTTRYRVELPNPHTYARGSETSIASPQVAGAASLVLSVNPNLTPADVEAILEATADNVYGVNPTLVGKLGAGRINVYRAVKYTLEHYGGAVGGAGLTVELPE